MSNDLAAVLDGIVRRHGNGILSDRARLFALLRDYAPGDLRAVRLLMTAYDSGAAGRLQAQGGAGPTPLQDETDRMVAGYGASPDLARAAILTWAAFAASTAGGASTQPIRPLPLPGEPVPVRPLPGSASPALSWKAALARWSLVITGLALRLARRLRRPRAS
ncbi:hypothetical protein [uncultured Enterovirga sp.]|uniref:hypothetical protein n=1 Tax=uncultured Enterovirga sp. TaxID=2026352 RepID=UPI0035CC07EE